MKTDNQQEFLFSIKNLIKNNNAFSILTGAYVFCWFTQIGKRIPFFETIRIELLLGSLLTVLSVYALANRSRNMEGSKAGTYAIILIVYYGIFSVLTYDPATSWMIYFDRVIKFSLLGLFIYALADNIYKVAFVLLCYFLAAAKAGQEGLIGFVTGNMVWENQGIPRLHGSIDMYGHPNSFSGFGVCLLPFIYCFYPLMNKYMKAALIFLAICAAVIILFTGSRTGYIATSFFLIYALFKTFRKSFLKFFFLAIPILIVAIYFLPDDYKGRFGSIFSQQDQEGGSTTARKQILFDGIDVFLAHPFGVGVGAFPAVREDMFGRTQDTHNLYLQVLTNTGFIGLILFFLFVRAIIKANQQIIFMHKDYGSEESKFLTALASATIGYIWARLFLGLFGMDMYEIYWWLAAGLTCANFHLTLLLKKAASNNPQALK